MYTTRERDIYLNIRILLSALIFIIDLLHGSSSD